MNSANRFKKYLEKYGGIDIPFRLFDSKKIKKDDILLLSIINLMTMNLSPITHKELAEGIRKSPHTVKKKIKKYLKSNVLIDTTPQEKTEKKYFINWRVVCGGLPQEGDK